MKPENAGSRDGKAHRLPRRGLFLLMTAGAFLAPVGCVGAAPVSDDGPIKQPKDRSDKAFLDRAFTMRQRAIDLGDQPYGAIVVLEGVIVGQSWSRVLIDQDPTGHAEMAAIRDASRRLARRDLHGSVLYSSARPCPMCEAAAYWAGIGEMVHGRDAAHAGSPELCRHN